MNTNMETGRAVADELRLDAATCERILNDCARWLRAYLDESGQKGFVLGLSGGVDSALVAKIAERAVGGERLLLMALPYGGPGCPSSLHHRSTPESIEHARLVAATIPGCTFLVSDIAHAVDVEAQDNGLYQALIHDPKSGPAIAAFSNLKARIRAVRLRTQANLNGLLLLGTENRSEYMTGYFTIDGDSASDIEPIEGLLKAHVWQLAAAAGVPEPIIAKAPSADLWEAQTDEGELGFSYDSLDLALFCTSPEMDEAREAARTGAHGWDDLQKNGYRTLLPAEARAIRRRIDATEYKRRPKPVYDPRPLREEARRTSAPAGSAEDVALIIVDVQNDFCPGGALAVRDGDRVARPLSLAAAEILARGGLVVATRDMHPPATKHFEKWPVHCVAGTNGAAFHPELVLPAGTLILSKGQGTEDDGYSAFDGTLDGSGESLASLLRRRNIRDVYIGGLATDYCVAATVLAACNPVNVPLLHVHVLTDAIRAVDLVDGAGDLALRQMEESGASLTSTPALLASLIARDSRAA